MPVSTAWSTGIWFFSAYSRTSWVIFTRVRAAHRAEVRRLGQLGGQRLGEQAMAVSGSSARVELILPAELKRALLSASSHAWAPDGLGEIGGVGGDLVGDQPCFTSSRLGRPRCSLGVT